MEQKFYAVLEYVHTQLSGGVQHRDHTNVYYDGGRCAWYRNEPVVLGEEMEEYIAYRKKLEKKLTSYQERKGDIII